MAEKPAEAPKDAGAPGPETRKKGGIVVTLMAALVGAGIGGGVGAMTLGPAVGARMALQGGQIEVVGSSGGGGDHGEDAGGEDDHGGSSSEAVTGELHMIENLVVNPAQSEGTRFLLVSVAVQATDAKAIETLVARDMEVRDALLRVLGAKTVGQLSDIDARAVLQGEIKAALQAIGGKAVRRIFIPQFVIQ